MADLHERIEHTIREFARKNDVYVPRIPDLTGAIYDNVVAPILGTPTEGAVWCPLANEHDTHLWTFTAPNKSSVVVRCPGRDGV